MPKNFPPGPFGLPLIGHLHLLGPAPHKTLMKWKKTHGPIIGIRFGMYRTVVIHDHKLIRESMNLTTLAGRPLLKAFITARSEGVSRGVVFTEGQVRNVFNAAVVSALWSIMFGERLDQEEPEVKDAINRIASAFESKILGNFATFHPKRNEMLFVLLDLFVGGSETTSTTLSWMCAYLIHHPQVQHKLQEEIDQVVGKERLPALADRPSMPYTEAVISEVLRYSSIFAMVLHKASEDLEFHGFFIPKDTIVLPNFYDAHFDEAGWGDPQNFRPERFLNEDVTFFQTFVITRSFYSESKTDSVSEFASLHIKSCKVHPKNSAIHSVTGGGQESNLYLLDTRQATKRVREEECFTFCVLLSLILPEVSVCIDNAGPEFESAGALISCIYVLTMRKNFESRIPKPITSKTETVCSKELWNSNHEKKSHVQFSTESLNFSEIRIKLVGTEAQPGKATRGRSEIKQRVPRGSTRSNTLSRSRRSSKSPQQKNKILVYETEKTKAKRAISPYMCDISRKEDPNAPSREIYVSDREFKLLKNAADLQQAAERRAPKFEKTLFGYVTVPGAPITSGLVGMDPPKNSSNTKPDQQHAPYSSKGISHMVAARRVDDKKKSKGQREPFVRCQSQRSKSQSTENRKSNKRQSRQNTSTSDHFTLTNAWDDDFQDSDSKMDEYRMFVAKFKEKFNKPYTESITSPFYPSPPTDAVKNITQDCQTTSGAEVNGNVDKKFSCNLIGQNNMNDSLTKSPEDTNNVPPSEYSSSILETVSSQWQDLAHGSHIRKTTSIEMMKRSILVATEASMVLMNTLFKDALHDPKSPARLVDSELFQKFILVETKVEALEKAASIFDAANKSIVEYLRTHNRSSTDSDLPQTSSDLGQISDICVEKLEVQELSLSLLDAKQSLDSTDSRQLDDEVNGSNSAFQSTSTSAQPQSISTVLPQDSEHSAKWIYNSDTDKKRLQMTMSTAQEPGFLLQNIICQDLEFHLNFVGNTRKVSSLISSSRARTKTIALTPFQLLDIIDQCLTHLTLRLGSTNQHLQLSSQRLGEVVKDYTEGRHGHYSKSLKRSNIKLQGLNNFAGFVLQITRVVTKISEKLLSSFDVLVKLNEILQETDAGEEKHDTGTDLVQPAPTHEAIVEVVSILDELENALEIGRNTFTAIYSKPTSDFKMKKSLREILDGLFQALMEFDMKNYIDFGSLLMSVVSCTAKLRDCTGKPRFDVTVRINILDNLKKIKVSISELQGTSKRMNFVSGYLVSKSLLNLKNNREAAKILEEKQSQIKNIPWYKRRLFSRVLERTYSMISIPSPVTMLSENEEDLGLNPAEITESSHYSTISAENESPPSSIHT
ncbi:unnamed protein product [Allacma fusca]|uniref:Cytochrome P450 n=2 Tax=Allacma fusca TaxID=39272 RepID=A0A8J2KRF6_9HEXA|nr:unnamed protein product [Allacma fusca]